MMRNILILFIFSFHFFLSKNLMASDSLGINYQSTEDNFYIFSGCDKKYLPKLNKNQQLTGKHEVIEVSVWKKLIEEASGTSHVNKYWDDYYLPFLEKCKNITESSSNKKKVADINYKLCQKDNYKIPTDITKWKTYCNFKDNSGNSEPKTEDTNLKINFKTLI